MQAATFFDGEGWRDGVLAAGADGRMLLHDEPPAAGLPQFDGVIVGGFTDHHVHLQLVDHALLTGSRLGRVVDLGAEPVIVAALAATAPSSTVHDSGTEAATRPQPPLSGPASSDVPELRTPHPQHRITIEYAGAFLTPVGGYPSDRSWASAGSFREIANTADAVAAVAEMADAGATRIKLASNGTAGPVFDDELFRAIVDAAAARGLPVVAHAEGSGEAQRAARLGAAVLAHAPFTERLGDDEIAAQAASVSWISTLSIHEGEARAVAIDNVRRFHAAGGTVLYGTDMGNGPTPVDLNPAEVHALREAGVDGAALLRALAPVDPRDPASVLLVLPATTSDPLDARILKV